MQEFKVEDQSTINMGKQLAYDYKNKVEILFWELQDRFSDYNQRNPEDQIEYITNNDIKEFKASLTK